MIAEAVRQLLLDDSNITAIVSERIISDFLPQGLKAPAIVFYRVNEDINNVLGGPLGVDSALFQIEAVGRTRAKANELQALIRKRIGGYRGTVAGVVIREANLQRAYDMDDLPEAGSDEHRYRSIVDVNFTYGFLERSC